MFYVSRTLLFAAIFVANVFTVSASAAVLTVNTLNDTDDSVCDASCSFRDAINVASPGDTIVFARQLRGGTIQLLSTLAVNKFVKVDGPNRRRITLKGDNTFRIIESHGNLWIDGLVISDGNAGAGDGGGILATGTLNLTNVGVVNNTAQRGGGIFMTGVIFIFADSLVAGNTALGDEGGGGIDVAATVYINNSTISGNRSLSKVGGAGGVRINNEAHNTGTIIQSTIAFNTSNGTSLVSAGGLAMIGIPIGPVMNTIIAKNIGVTYPDHYKGFAATNCLIGVTYPASGIVTGVNGNIVGDAANPVDPLLAPLSDNGGLPTHALQSGSLAIDSGNNDRATDRRGIPLLVDQRGFTRVVNSTVDRGSYESGAQALSRPSSVLGRVVGANGRGVSGARVELRDANGGVSYAITNPFGYYRFTNVTADLTYTLNCSDKRNTFPEQQLLVEEATEYVDFGF